MNRLNVLSFQPLTQLFKSSRRIVELGSFGAVTLLEQGDVKTDFAHIET
jgi:hypothetical protein